MTMRLLFPGSFDPPHFGHVDILGRASSLAATAGGEVIIGVAENPEKPGFLPVPRRVDLLTGIARGFPNVRALSFAGATVRYAQEAGITTLVRGLRHAQDLESEKAMAEVNRRNGVDTVFFLTDARWSFLSSNFIRGVRAAGLPLADLVPAPVAAALKDP